MGGYGNPQPGSSSLRKIIEADSVDVCKDTLYFITRAMNIE